MLEPAIVVPGPRNNTLYNFKVTARQRVVYQPRKEHVTYYVRCVKCGVAQYSYHIDCLLETLALSWLELLLSVAMTLHRTWLLSLLFIYPPLHIFIFRLLNTFNTHLPTFRFTTLWLLLDVFCYFDVNVWREHIVEVKISLKWIWKRLFQCFSSFIDKLIGW